MDCASEPDGIAAGAGALPGARRRCEAGKRTHGPGPRACLALLAATALLALAAPAQAQTEIWSATLTPQVISSSGTGTLGCENSNPAAQQCSNTSVLSDNDFTLGSTDHTIGVIGLTGGGNFSFLSTSVFTAPDTLVLEVGTTSLAFSDGVTVSSGAGRIWLSTGLSWTVGTDVSVRLISLTAPGAPTGLAATATGPSQIDLAWTAPASTGGSAITGYKIEVSPDGTSWSDRVADTQSTATAYAHMGLNAATTRHYRVSAINAVGTSDPSGTDDATTEANTVTAQTVFISNTEQPDGSVTTLSSNYFAQQFQTGSNVGGYTLSEIVVSLATASSAFTPAFAIHRTTTDSSSREVPGTEVVGLVGSVAATGLQGFTPDSATTLSASTKYFVVFKGTSSGTNPILQQASSGAVDPGFATGWEIPVGILNSTDSGSTWSVRISSQSYKIQIKGTASTNTAPTAANKTVTTGEDRAYAFTADDVVTKAQIDGDMLTFTPARDAHGDPYTTFTFTVNDGTDDSASAYTMTIDVTDAPAPVCAVPNIAGDGRRQIWTGTVTVGVFSFMGSVTGYGFDGVLPAGTLLPSQSFFIGSNNYVIDAITVSLSGSLHFSLDGFSFLTATETAALRLHVCDGDYDFSTANNSQQNTTTWSTNLDWSDPVESRTVYLSLPANNAATGAPTITGTTEVGQTLTAVTTGIVDANGLTSPGYTYQWIRVNGTEADIAGENSSTYTLVDADRRRTNEKDDFRVRGRHHADGGIRPGAGRRLVGHFHTRRYQWIRVRLPKWLR